MTNEENRWPEARPVPRPRVPCTVCGRPLRDFDAGDQCRSCIIASMGTARESRRPKKRGRVGDWVSAVIDVIGEALIWPF